MKKLHIFLLISISLLFISSQAFAYTLTISYDNGTTQQTAALTGYATNGAMMDGMDVTAYFLGGGSETEDWADTGATSGGVTGTGWSLNESSDTFGGTWTLTVDDAITGLFIDAGTGDSVFDITWPTSASDPLGYGTDGSARGWTFEVTGLTNSNFNGNIAVTYVDIVTLTGDAPVGDLWRYLDIQFTDPTGAPAGFTGTLTFIQDTDNLQFAGDINPVPEPASLILIGTGLLGLAGLRRRIRKV